MKPNRRNTTVLLIDMRYDKSLNAFEEFYRESVTYQELEQESYVEFKDFIFEEINKDIKFRKYGRIGPILTIKADMLENEINQFKLLLEQDKIKLIHNWAVTNVTIIRDNDELDIKRQD